MGSPFEHGYVRLKQPITDVEGNDVVSEDEIGVVTAYLPDMEKFAVMFSRDRWITFSETEEEFKERVTFLKDEV